MKKIFTSLVMAIIMLAMCSCAAFGNNNGDNSEQSQYESTDIDSTLVRSLERYSIVSAPLTNYSPPIMASSTDYTYNYFILDAGYVNNVPISSGMTVYYNGQTAMTVRFEQSTVTTQKVEESLSKAVSESISETTTAERGGKLQVDVGMNDWPVKFSVEYHASRTWGTVTEKANSTTNTYTVAHEKVQSLTQAIEFTIGNNNESIGDYRLSMMATCDVYYFVKTNRNNTSLEEFEIVFCARPDVRFVLEYDDKGNFGKTANSSVLDLDSDFYRGFEVPTEVVTYTIALNVESGNKLTQNSTSVILGNNYTLPVPTRNLHAFIGWFSSPNGAGERYTNHNGESLKNWGEPNDRELYAYWVRTTKQIDLGTIALTSQQIYSQKTAPFDLALDIASLQDVGYRYLSVSISGFCSDYDYKMNNYGRYFVLYDTDENAILSWTFVVSGFNGVSSQNIPLEDLNLAMYYYQLQLISDYSPAYDEKLVVNSLVITLTLVK